MEPQTSLSLISTLLVVALERTAQRANASRTRAAEFLESETPRYGLLRELPFVPVGLPHIEEGLFHGMGSDQVFVERDSQAGLIRRDVRSSTGRRFAPL